MRNDIASIGKKIAALTLAAALLFAGGACFAEPDGQAGEPEAAFEFNPHVYSPMLAQEIPQDYWDSFYNLCDALRAGGTTFACSSREAYEWATDNVVLGHLFPPACTKVSGESNDGTTPFEGGVGRIYYSMPIEEYVKRQAEFEAVVTDVLNTWLEPDDNDFEKCLKLYDYMESDYCYDYGSRDYTDGAHYYSIMNQRGICSELSGVYAYFLLQVGVDAQQVGCCIPYGLAHAWTYVVLDGKGYHIDPTWGLKSELGTEGLCLQYFMITDEARNSDGCLVEELTADLLPEYWTNRSLLDYSATDDSYSTRGYALLTSLDEEEKIVYYTDLYGLACQMSYR